MTKKNITIPKTFFKIHTIHFTKQLFITKNKEDINILLIYNIVLFATELFTGEEIEKTLSYGKNKVFKSNSFFKMYFFPITF